MIRTITRYLLLVIVFTICWMLGMGIGLALFPSDLMSEAQNASFDPMILVISGLHTAILYLYVRLAGSRGWSMIFRLTLISFGLTYFITQVETLWFIESVHMDIATVKGLLFGGLLSSFLFSWVLVKISGKDTLQTMESSVAPKPHFSWKTSILFVLLLIVVWPLLYFLAGYYIAWQSEAVRVYYTSSGELKSFYDMMVSNVRDGLYTFQVIRSFIWLGLALLISYPIRTRSIIWQVLITGGLFAILGSSQLLLENPLMPEDVRVVHLVETAISTFIWGGILGYFLNGVWSHSQQEVAVSL